MKTSYIIALVVIVVIIAAGIAFWAYSPNSSYAPATASTSTAMMPATTPTAATTTPSATPSPTVVLNVMTSPTLGAYLVATNGMTLYTSSGSCTAQCAILWPSYTVSATGALVGGLNIAGAVGLTGNHQVTYNGKSLYFWSKDGKPGDTTGENVGGFVVAKP